jgi:dihydrofolate reductase
MPPPPITLILAADLKEGIAKQGDLPWHLPEDLKRFKHLTVGRGHNAVLMGRATWDSVPPRFRPLAGRLNIVLSRKPDPTPGATLVHSWDEALAAASHADELWVVGGADLYRQALARDDIAAIELTRVLADFECDLSWRGVPADYICTATQECPARGQTPASRYERWEPSR